MKMELRVTLVFFRILFLFLFNPQHVSADQTATLVPSRTYGTWEGWGVSLAWWAKAFGNNANLADIFFTKNQVTYRGAAIPGLGFNIVRYNAGATSFEPSGGQRIVQSSGITPARQIDAFWINSADSDPASASWNWTVDTHQRNLLQLAKSRGANIFELFSNSPVWWQCANHNPSGSSNGVADNLGSTNYGQHVTYLATVARHAKDSWGINFQSVEAFNEPSSGYWVGPSGSQEGCHIGAVAQAAIVPLLRAKLNNLGLGDVSVSASDETSYDLAVSTWNSFSNSVRSQVKRINVHGYQGGGGDRVGLYNLAVAGGKGLWNSEYGDGDGTGKSLASNLILDLRFLHPTAWVYWQAIDIKGWGLITGDNTAVTTAEVSQKYYVLAQFTRHIRPGFVLLETGTDYAVAAYNAASRTLVIVAINWGAAQYLNFELAAFKTPGKDGALVQRWTTQIGSGIQYANAKDTYMRGTKFWSYFGSQMIQTFEISDVSL